MLLYLSSLLRGNKVLNRRDTFAHIPGLHDLVVDPLAIGGNGLALTAASSTVSGQDGDGKDAKASAKLPATQHGAIPNHCCIAIEIRSRGFF